MSMQLLRTYHDFDCMQHGLLWSKQRDLRWTKRYERHLQFGYRFY